MTIVTEERIADYLGNELGDVDWSGRGLGTRAKLAALDEHTLKVYGLSGIDYLFLAHHVGGMTLREAAAEFGGNLRTLRRVFEKFGLPVLSSAESQDTPAHRQKRSDLMNRQWEKPAFAARVSETARDTMRRKWDDPDFQKRKAVEMSERSSEMWKDDGYREKMREVGKRVWDDEGFRARNAEGVRRNWKDPGFRMRHADGVRSKYASDPDFAERQAKASSERLKAKWRDPEYRAARTGESIRRWADPDFKYAASIAASKRQRRKWDDPDYRASQTKSIRETWRNPSLVGERLKALREVRMDPANQARYALPSVAGERWDTGYAKSAWEANVARVFEFFDRSFRAPSEVFRLDVPERFSELFPSGSAEMTLDFVVRREGKGDVYYEIMPSVPNPKKRALLELLVEQQHGIDFRIIDDRFYALLERRFGTAINADPQFAGWEGRGNNLRSNPERYGKFE